MGDGALCDGIGIGEDICELVDGDSQMMPVEEALGILELDLGGGGYDDAFIIVTRFVSSNYPQPSPSDSS